MAAPSGHRTTKRKLSLRLRAAGAVMASLGVKFIVKLVAGLAAVVALIAAFMTAYTGATWKNVP